MERALPQPMQLIVFHPLRDRSYCFPMEAEDLLLFQPSPFATILVEAFRMKSMYAARNSLIDSRAGGRLCMRYSIRTPPNENPPRISPGGPHVVGAITATSTSVVSSLSQATLLI